MTRTITLAVFFWLSISNLGYAAAGITITVAQDGTGDFSDLIVAIESINDASKNKRYVVDIKPGTYFLSGSQLFLKPYVSLKGAGKFATIIQSAVSDSSPSVCTRDSAVVVSENSVNDVPILIQDMSIRNFIDTPDDGVSAAVYIDGQTTVLQNVLISVRGKSPRKCGIAANSRTEIERSEVYVANSTGDAVGIFASGTTVSVKGSQVKASTNNPSMAVTYGVVATEANTLIDDTTIIANYGVTSSLSEVSLEKTKIISSRASYTVDDLGLNSPAARINNSTLIGQMTGIDMDGKTTLRIINTEIRGAILDDPAGTQCLQVYDGDLTPRGC